MAQYGFGLGFLSLTDTSQTTQNPIVCGVLQDVSLDISMTVKELRGSLQFPVDIARSTGTVTGKAKFAQISAGVVNAILAGSTIGAGMKIASINEAKTPAANSTTVTGGVNFYENIAVVNATTGVLMTRMADGTAQGSITTGNYVVNSATGAYTFATVDSNPPVLITYTYTASATGKTVTFTNQLMGASTTFKLDLHNNFKSKNYGIRLPAVVIPKLAFAPKQDDYMAHDLDFSAFADSSGKILDFFSTE
jgi:hypothetical protein